MINCTLSKDQVRTFRKKVTNDLADILKNPNRTFNLKDYVRSIYDVVYNATKNQNLALDYARLTPTVVSQIMGVRMSDFGQLGKKGFSYGELFDLNQSFIDKENGFKNIADYLEVQKSEIEQVEEIISTVENEQAKKKAEENYLNNRAPLPNRPKPISALTTTFQELIDEDDYTKGKDPDMVYYTNFVKDVLSNRLADRVSPDELSGINYPGVEGGLHLSLMPYRDIPESQLYPNFGVRKWDQLKRESQFVYVVTDKNGKPVTFDNNYNVSDKGKYIYYSSRYLPKKKNGKWDYTELENVQRPAAIAENLGISVEEAERILDAEFDTLEQKYNYLNTNPGKSLLFVITGGSLGGIAGETTTYVDTDKINLEGKAFSVSFLKAETVNKYVPAKNAIGGLYMIVDDCPLPIFLKIKNISADDIDMIYSLLTENILTPSGAPISAATKFTVIKSLIQLSKTGLNIKEENGKLVLYSKTTAIPTEKIKEELANAKYAANIKEINSGTTRNYFIRKDERTKDNILQVENTPVKTYLGKISQARVSLDKENKLQRYNPYFDVMPYYDQQNKIDNIETEEDVKPQAIIPEEAAARIDLVQKFGYDQAFIDGMSSDGVVTLYREELEKVPTPTPEQTLTPETFNKLSVKEKKDALVDVLKQGTKVSGTIVKPESTRSQSKRIFRTYKGSEVIFYNTAVAEITQLGEDDYGKKVTLKLVDKVTDAKGVEYENVIQVYLNDKYVGNIAETDIGNKTQQAIDEVERAIEQQDKDIQSTGITPDDTSIDPDSILGESNFLDNIKDKLDSQTNIQATKKQIAEAKKWYEASPLSKYIPFKVMFNAINTRTPGSIATWDVQGITLFKGSDYSDLYHEAWHGFTQLFMTKEQKDRLYKEARKQKGTFKSFRGVNVSFANATLEELEEHLAENFREYMLSGGKKKFTNAPVKNSLFQWLLDLLKSLFGKSRNTDGSNDYINNLYEKLRVGNINEYTFYQKNAHFSELNSRRFIPQDQGVNEPSTLSPEDAQLMVDTVDSLFAEYVLEQKKRKGLVALKVLKLTEGRAEAYRYAKAKLIERLEKEVITRGELLDKIKEATNKQTISKLNTELADTNYNIGLLLYTVKNFGDSTKPGNTFGLVKYHYDRSTFLDFDDTMYDDFASQNVYDKNEFERKSGNETAMKGLADSSFLWMVKTLFEVNPVTKEYKKNRLGFNALANFDYSWNRLMNVTEGSINIDDVYSKLKEAKSDYPVISQFLERIGLPEESVTSKAATSMWTQIVKIATMPRINLVLFKLKIDELKDNKTAITPTVTQSQGEFGKIGKVWNADFVTRQAGKFIKTTDTTNRNYLDIAAVLDEFSNNSRTKEITADNVFEFLEAVGITLEQTKIAKESFLNEGLLNEVNAGIFRSLKNIEKYNNRYPAAPITIYKPDDIVYDYVSNNKISKELSQAQDKESLGLKSGISGSASRWNALQQWQLRWSDWFTDTTTSNANNDNQYERSTRSTISQRLTKLNSGATRQELTADPTMNDLDSDRNPFAATSIYLDRLFDSRGLRKAYKDPKTGKFTKALVELKNMSGFSKETKDINDIITSVGVASASADPLAKQMMDFYMMMWYGVSEATRHADKSTTYLYRFLDEYGKSYPLDMRNFLGEGNTLAIRDIYLKYLAAELVRIGKLKTGDPSGNVVLSKTKTYKDVGSKIFVFDKILDSALKSKLEQLTFTNVNDALNYLKSTENVELRQRFDNQLSAYLNELAGKTQEFLDSINFSQNEQLYRSILERMMPLDKDGKTVPFFKMTKEVKDQLLKKVAYAYATMSWIHKYESTVLLYGDPALYEDVDNFFKRNAGTASTGDIPRSDKYMVQFINDRQSRISYAAKKRGVTPKSWSETLTAAVLQDPVTESVYLKEYIESAKNVEVARLKRLKKSDKEIAEATAEIETIFKDAYGKMKPADGQGYITFDAYRNLLLSLDKWTDYQEDLYVKIVNGETIPDTVDVLQFFPVKKMQMYGPLQTDGLPVWGFHKYSLLPLIPNMLQNSQLEALHNKLVDQNVDYATFQTGSKLASVTNNGVIDKFYNYNNRRNEKGEIDDTLAINDPTYQFAKNVIFLDYFKDQLEVSNVYKGKNTFSTQLRKLIEDGLMAEGVPTDWKPELLSSEKRYQEWNALSDDQKIKSGSKNYETLLVYEGLLNRLVDINKQELREQIKGKGKKGLIEFVQKELTRKEMTDHAIDFVSENAFDLSGNVENIEKILVAVVEKRLINLKVTGEALVQVSGVGFEKSGRVRKATQEEIDRYGTNGLTFYKSGKNKTSAMKIKLSMQGAFKNLLNLPEVIRLSNQSQGRLSRLDALNSLLKNEEWLDTSGVRKMITSVAVRIPVQGLNSMEFMEIYEFLPESSGNIIILPDEIVAKSGGDFDIDKMFTLFPNLRTKTKLTFDAYNANEELKAKVGFKALKRLQQLQTISEEEGIDYLNDKDKEILSILDKYGYTTNVVELIDNDKKQGVENKLLSVMAEILALPSNFTRLITPNTTVTMEDIAETMAIKTRGSKKASPTEMFEIDMNLYKQQSNSLGKAILGIIAVSNTFSTLFKRTGLLMELTGEISTTKDGIPVMHRQKLLVPHNIINGKISLSGLYTQDGTKAIADLISQMINGSVDVAKNAWIFDAQAHPEAVNSLLFMIMAGTPPKHAVAFLAQPIIKDYFAEIARVRSIGSAATGVKDPGNFFRLEARDKIIDAVIDTPDGPVSKYGFEFNTDQLVNAEGRITKEAIFKALEAVADQGAEQLKNLKALENNISTKPKTEYSDMDRAAFAHFLEIREMTNKVTSVTQTLNFDTAKLRTLLSAYLKQEKIGDLSKGISPKVIKNLMDNSPIAAFGVSEFLLELFEELFPLRNNRQVIDRIKSMMLYVPGQGSQVNKYVKNTIFEDSDAYVERWRNDLISYIWQSKYYDTYKVGNEYGGLPVVYVPYLQKGVALTDGALYVSLKDVNALYNSEKNIYKNLFEVYSNPEARKQLFLKFLLEKELMFNRYKDSFEEIKKTKEYKALYKENAKDPELEAFNRLMAEKAADAMNLHERMFYGETAYAKQVMNLKTTHPNLFRDYPILNNLELVEAKVGAKVLYNLKIQGMPDVNQKNIFYNNMLNLMNPDVKKVRDARQNARISELFKRFTVFALLQSGTDTGSSMSLIDYAPPSEYLKLVEEPYNEFIKLSDAEINNKLTEYTTLFNDQYSISHRKTAKKVKNFAGIAASPFDISVYEPYEIEGAVDAVLVQPTTSVQAPVTAEQIYSQLDTQTKTPNIVISGIKTKDGKYDRDANIKEAEVNERIYSMETDSDLSFSNPWAHFNRKGTIKTETTKEAVKNYIDWLTTDKFKDVKPKRREWILNQLKSGKLKGKVIQYYAELKEPSHATALDYLINKYDWSKPTTPAVSTGFQGYKGGFEDKGKGTPEGDGKDKAMRQVADGFIGEHKPVNTQTSTRTSFNVITFNLQEKEGVRQGNSNFAFETQDKFSKKYEQRYQGKSGKTEIIGVFNNPKVVMLARNGEYKGEELNDNTKGLILQAHNQGAEFVVGDMPGVDSQFIDYLQQIGAKFTVYHTGNTPRINISKPTIPTVSTQSINTIINPEDITFKSNKLEIFERAEGLESVKGYGLLIKNQPNTELFTYKDKDGWNIIDNKSKRKLPLRGTSDGNSPTKNEISKLLSDTLTYYASQENSRKVLEGVGFSFTQTPVTTEEKQDYVLVESTGPIKNPGTIYKLEKFKYTIGVNNEVFVLRKPNNVGYADFYSESNIKQLLSYYPNAVFIHNAALQGGVAVDNNTAFKALGPEHSYGLFTKLGSAKKEYTTEKSKSTENKTIIKPNALNIMRDATPSGQSLLEENKKRIDEQIAAMKAIKASGKMLIFDAMGYGQNMIGMSEYSITEPTTTGAVGVETFKYLSEQLLRNFGYLNPNYVTKGSGGLVLSSLMPVTPEQIREFKLNCLRIKS